MNWKNSQSVEDLKSLGKFNEVKAKVKGAIEGTKLTPGLTFKCTPVGWSGLWAVIQKYKEISGGTATNAKTNGVEKSQVSYFQSLEAKMIFALLELDGESRNNLLGLTDKHYRSKDEAQKWRRQITKVIHPDKSENPLAEKATQKINEIYKILTN